MRILEVEIDLDSGTVWRSGEVLDLPDLSYRLLVALVRHAPALVTKDDLIAEVWGEVVVSDETLMQRVRLLRQAIGDDSRNPRYINSVRGRGYRLAAPVAAPETVKAQAPAGTGRRARWVAAVGALALVIFGVAVGILRPDPEPPAIRSLAVLPFDDLSEDRRVGFFADGMQEALLARLAGLDEVSVRSRTSVERFRNGTESIPDIASSLDADGLIEGSVQVSGDRLRITVQLIDGRTDRHLWAQTFEEALTVENLFAIQDRVADAIADALRAEYRAQQSVALGLPTSDIEAYNLYLLGRYQVYRLTPDSLELGAQFLAQAISRDQEFAQAHAALGWAYLFQASVYGEARPNTVIPLARDAALRALELDDRLADAHSLYADILTWYDWQFELAEAEYRRAVSLDPLNVLGYALFLSTQARHEEAIEVMERRLAATPEDDFVRINAGWRYLHAGRYAEAIDAASQADSHPDAGSLLGHSYLASGATAKALSAFEEDLRRRGRGQMQVGNLAVARFMSGQMAEGQSLLEELEAQEELEFVSPVLLAGIYFAAGNADRGYELLDAAIDVRARGVIFLNVNPVFSGQRHDARFIALAERVGLPAEDTGSRPGHSGTIPQ